MKRLLLLFCLLTTPCYAATYYVASDGTGNYSTNATFNAASFAAGDTVLFKNGSEFRGQWILKGGSAAGGRITYGTYGASTVRPVFYGSQEENSAANWTDAGSNIWVNMNLPKGTGKDVGNIIFNNAVGAMRHNNTTAFVNTTFTNTTYVNSTGNILDAVVYIPRLSYQYNSTGLNTTPVILIEGARTNLQHDSHFSVVGGVVNGSTTQGTAWIHNGLDIFERSTTNFTNPYGGAEVLHIAGADINDRFFKNGSNDISVTNGVNYTTSALMRGSGNIAVGGYNGTGGGSTMCPEVTLTNAWRLYSCTYTNNATGVKGGARIGLTSANAVNAYVAYVQFEAGDNASSYIPNPQVGDNVTATTTADGAIGLNTQGDFWTEYITDYLYLYSVANPAIYYSDVECALHYDTINTTESYITLSGVDVKYGGRHGINFRNCTNITLTDLNVSFIGGAWKTTDKERLGNGIQFYDDIRDAVTNRVRITECYDAGWTWQSNADNIQAVNVALLNSIISNCEYSVELWDNGDRTGATVSNLSVYYNTFQRAGSTFGHYGRVNGEQSGTGTHLQLGAFPLNASQVAIKYNIMKDSYSRAVKIQSTGWGTACDINNNIYNNTTGVTFGTLNASNYATFGDWKTATNLEANSSYNDPLLQADFTILKNSPAVNNGTTVSFVTTDYWGTTRPQGSAYDIGAMEVITVPGNVNSVIRNIATIKNVTLQ